MSIYLQNTLTGKKEEFKSLKEGVASMYNCGPTVYNYAHIGNLRSYVFSDILRRVLQYNGYSVKQVINVTDIGHLSSDNDEGEDKMTKALKREGKPLNLKSMREVADFYFGEFIKDLGDLNIEMPEEFPFASDHIGEDIELIRSLTEKGFTYETSDGVYFDTSKFPDYGKLGNIKSTDTESRIGENPEKKNQRDFAVWKFNKELGYESPFGKGFPGWHIECSAMSVKYLGKEFDIHTGGIDHIPVHHNNEIAQSVCAGYPYAKYWLHNAHLNIGESKMAKSGENFITLNTLKEKKIDPLALRYIFLSARYSSPLDFSWDALEGAETALRKIKENFLFFLEPDGSEREKFINEQINLFKKYINDDLNTPEALSCLWNVINSTNLSQGEKKLIILNFNKVLGFDLYSEIPLKIKELEKKRAEAKISKDFEKSDKLRREIEELGWEIKDTKNGSIIYPSPSASPSAPPEEGTE